MHAVTRPAILPPIHAAGILWSAFWAGFAAFHAAGGGDVLPLHLLAMLGNLVGLAVLVALLVWRVRLVRTLDRLDAEARLLLRVRAWGSVCWSRVVDGDPRAVHARIGCIRALDLLASHRAAR